jgi:uncharacterized membrane protein YdjX (TVP38/TMEM64 family)
LIHKNLIRILLVSLLFSGLSVSFWYREYFTQDNLILFADWFQSLGAWGIMLYLVIYSIGPVFGIPAIPLTLLGGMLFGPVWGAALAITGATIADSLGFLLARYAGRDFIEPRLGKSIERVKRGVEEEGWRFVAFLRLTPIFPFGVVSYLMGLTRISFGVYALTTFLCLIPAASAYAYLGHAGRQALLAGQIKQILIGIAVVSAVAFLPLFVRRVMNSKAAQSMSGTF